MEDGTDWPFNYIFLWHQTVLLPKHQVRGPGVQEISNETEIDDLYRNMTSPLVPGARVRNLPINKRILHKKYAVATYGNIYLKYNASLARHGYQQLQGIDGGELLATRFEIHYFRLLLAVVAMKNLGLYQIDRGIKFVNSVHSEDISINSLRALLIVTILTMCAKCSTHSTYRNRASDIGLPNFTPYVWAGIPKSCEYGPRFYVSKSRKSVIKITM